MSRSLGDVLIRGLYERGVTTLCSAAGSLGHGVMFTCGLKPVVDDMNTGSAIVLKQSFMGQQHSYRWDVKLTWTVPYFAVLFWALGHCSKINVGRELLRVVDLLQSSDKRYVMITISTWLIRRELFGCCACILWVLISLLIADQLESGRKQLQFNSAVQCEFLGLTIVRLSFLTWNFRN